MKRIKAEEFVGPRAYFTAFDPKIVDRAKDTELLKKEIERKLKILLLLKSKVVCAASHLASDFVYQIFKDNPFLLNQEHIIPALRTDKQNIEELFEKKKLNDQDRIVDFYKDNVKAAVDWNLKENSAWFQKQFISELENQDSLIMKHLTKISPVLVKDIINEVKKPEILSRDVIENMTRIMPESAKVIVLNFRELVYHMSGARVVNCESSLPQENYIDYDIADLEQKRTKLSEEQILWKLFFELACETCQNQMISIEYLDRLSFKDILAIREPLMASSFQRKYDLLIKKVIYGIQNADKGILFDISELNEIRESLESTFKAVFEKEDPYFKKGKNLENLKNLRDTSCSIGLGVLGFIPTTSLIAGSTGILKEIRALFFNIGQIHKNMKSLSDKKIYLLRKEECLKNKIKQSELSEKSLMLEMVDLFTSTLLDKMKM